MHLVRCCAYTVLLLCACSIYFVVFCNKWFTHCTQWSHSSTSPIPALHLSHLWGRLFDRLPSLSSLTTKRLQPLNSLCQLEPRLLGDVRLVKLLSLLVETLQTLLHLLVLLHTSLQVVQEILKEAFLSPTARLISRAVPSHWRTWVDRVTSATQRSTSTAVGIRRKAKKPIRYRESSRRRGASTAQRRASVPYDGRSVSQETVGSPPQRCRLGRSHSVADWRNCCWSNWSAPTTWAHAASLTNKHVFRARTSSRSIWRCVQSLHLIHHSN